MMVPTTTKTTTTTTTTTMTTMTTTRTTTTTTRTRTRRRRRTRSNNNNDDNNDNDDDDNDDDDNEDAARSMSCPQVQMKSPSLFPSPDPYRHRRCAKLYNIYNSISRKPHHAGWLSVPTWGQRQNLDLCSENVDSPEARKCLLARFGRDFYTMITTGKPQNLAAVPVVNSISAETSCHQQDSARLRPVPYVPSKPPASHHGELCPRHRLSGCELEPWGLGGSRRETFESVWGLQVNAKRLQGKKLLAFYILWQDPRKSRTV